MPNLEKLDEPVIYVCDRHANFAFRAGTTRFVFDKHVLRVHYENHVEEIDALIADIPAFSQKLRKADIKAAEALVAAHRKTQGGAAKGMFTSDHSPEAKTPMREIDAEFGTVTGESEAKMEKEFAKEKGAAAQKSTNISADTSVRTGKSQSVQAKK